MDSAEFMLATLTNVYMSLGTAKIQIDGMTSENAKTYRVLANAWPLSAGDRVVVLKMSGTYLILGKISNTGASALPIGLGGSGQTGTTFTSTNDDIATAETGWTISSAVYSQWGKVAMVNISAKTTASVSTGALNPIAKLISGKLPRYQTPATALPDSYGPAFISMSGEVCLLDIQTLASGKAVTINSTYILQ